MILAAVLLAVQSDSIVARWRESIELDLPREVVGAGAQSMKGDGPFARDGAAIALYARALFATGDEAGATKFLAAARPDEDTRPFVELARARIAIERDDLEGASKILLAEGKPRFPDWPECRLLAGRALYRSGKGELAAPLLEGFLAAAPHDVEAPAAWHMLTQIAIGKRDLARAETLRAKAAESGKWQAFYRTRRLQVREHPDEPLPRLGLVELWLAADELDRAALAAAELNALKPDFCRGWEILGVVQRRRGAVEDARKILERALACDAKLATANLELARLLESAGEKDAAAERYRRYVELGGKEPLTPR